MATRSTEYFNKTGCFIRLIVKVNPTIPFMIVLY